MSVPLVSSLDAALTSTGALVAQVGDSAWSASTPCTDWTVRDLVNHLVAGNRLFADILAGTRTLEQARGAGPVDELGQRPTLAYQASARELVEAFARPGALAETVTVPFGTVPAPVALHLRISETLTHGWDLAQAIGLPTDFPDEIVLDELEFTRAALTQIPPGRSPFGPPQPVHDDAPPIERLVALLGRPVPPG